MRSFTDLEQLIGQVPASVVRKLRLIDVGRGSEALHRDQLPGLLVRLADRARVASVKASSAIEGVVVADEARAEIIARGQTTGLRGRNEQQLAGYRKAVDYLWQSDWGPLNIGLIQHLHRLLFSETSFIGGQFKTDDNIVVDRLADGSQVVRFTPVPARDVDFYTTELILRYQVARQADFYHPILLTGLFVIDLLVIHPFDDGNGRVARALTNALLQECGYEVTRYVSIEETIARTADEYYAALLASTHGWHNGAANPWPWLEYFSGLVSDAYSTFADRAAADVVVGTKQDRVQEYLLNDAGPEFRLADIRRALPGISDQTIRLALTQLRTTGKLVNTGAGRSATWRRC